MSLKQQARMDRAAVDAFRAIWEARYDAINARIAQHSGDSFEPLIADIQAIENQYREDTRGIFEGDR